MTDVTRPSSRELDVAQRLAAARAGDQEVLAELLASAGEQVRAGLQISAKWRAMIEPDDVMQVTYVEALERFSYFVGQTESALVSWLNRIAQNNLIDAIRELDRDKRPPPSKRVTSPGRDASSEAWLALLGAVSTTPSRVVAIEEARQILRQALADLPPRYAEVLRRLDLEGQAGRDAAAAMGCSRVAVYMLRARARQALADALGSVSRILG